MQSLRNLLLMRQGNQQDVVMCGCRINANRQWIIGVVLIPILALVVGSIVTISIEVTLIKIVIALMPPRVLLFSQTTCESIKVPSKSKEE